MAAGAVVGPRETQTAAVVPPCVRRTEPPCVRPMEPPGIRPTEPPCVRPTEPTGKATFAASGLYSASILVEASEPKAPPASASTIIEMPCVRPAETTGIATSPRSGLDSALVFVEAAPPRLPPSSAAMTYRLSETRNDATPGGKEASPSLLRKAGSVLSSASSIIPLMVSAGSIGSVVYQRTRALTMTLRDIIDRDFEEYEIEDAARCGTLSRMSRSTPPMGGLPLFRYKVKKMLLSRIFDMAIGVVIIANSATIGIELSLRLEGKDTSLVTILEDIWLAIYIVELCLRFFSMGLECLHDNWVKFDMALVVVGIVNSWILRWINSEELDGFGFLMVMRMTRLGRLARTVRLLVKFKVLWMLVRGLLGSAGTMFYTFLLLSIIVYVFAAVGVELITKNPLVAQDEEFHQIVMSHFDSLSGTMLTLVQFLCMDSIGAIYRPLIRKDATLLFYFVCVILVVPIVLMNLVTAIIVNSALEQATADKEAQAVFEENRKARLVKKLKGIFIRLDEDRSGQVSKDEIVKIDSCDVSVLEHATGICDPLEVFDALNVDGSDAISIDDFSDGIWKMATSQATIEVQRMEKQVQVMYHRIKSLEQQQSESSHHLDNIERGQALILEQLMSLTCERMVPSLCTATGALVGEASGGCDVVEGNRANSLTDGLPLKSPAEHDPSKGGGVVQPLPLIDEIESDCRSSMRRNSNGEHAHCTAPESDWLSSGPIGPPVAFNPVFF